MAHFFPVIFALPLFGGYLARHWLWTFTPSLSYVGQGVLDSSPSVVTPKDCLYRYHHGIPDNSEHEPCVWNYLVRQCSNWLMFQ